jgi:hypothetical protein
MPPDLGISRSASKERDMKLLSPYSRNWKLPWGQGQAREGQGIVRDDLAAPELTRVLLLNLLRAPCRTCPHKEPLTHLFFLKGHKGNYLLFLPSLRTFLFEVSWLPTLVAPALFISPWSVWVWPSLLGFLSRSQPNPLKSIFFLSNQPNCGQHDLSFLFLFSLISSHIYLLDLS